MYIAYDKIKRSSVKAGMMTMIFKSRTRTASTLREVSDADDDGNYYNFDRYDDDSDIGTKSDTLLY